jgi:hypothetical protein
MLAITGACEVVSQLCYPRIFAQAILKAHFAVCVREEKNPLNGNALAESAVMCNLSPVKSLIMVVLQQLAPTTCCHLEHNAENMLDYSEERLGRAQSVVGCLSLS